MTKGRASQISKDLESWKDFSLLMCFENSLYYIATAIIFQGNPKFREIGGVKILLNL